MPIELDGSPLQVAQVVAVARDADTVTLSADARARVIRTREALEGCLTSGETIYGVNTGFGSLSRQRIAPGDLPELQTNLLRSHAAGIGRALPTEVVRAMLLLLAGSLTRARSGVRAEVVDAILGLLNKSVTPIVPETGSVGASGDLAPLSHACLVLLGEGQAEIGGEVMGGGEALRRAGLTPISLQAKEGLGLINGTHLMAGRLALIWHDFERVFSGAVTAAAMSIDACRGTDSYLDERVYEARNQAGAAHVARLVRARMEGSEILSSHRSGDPRVQDPYSFRCAPVVLGSVRDAGVYVRERLLAELGAVSDNPLVFATEDGADVVSAGNFHGMPVALPMDVLAIAISHMAGVAERRVYHMLAAFDTETNLNPFLSPQPGLHSGLMIAQYTAAAACNELIGLANPASVANLSTSAGMEDYNSFGPRSAAKAARGVELARNVIAIELLCAAQAIEAHRPLKTGTKLERAHAIIRERVEALTVDRSPTPDVEAIGELIAAGAFEEI